MTAKVHYFYEKPECRCGDSFCAECREVVLAFGCKYGKQAPRCRTTDDIRKVSCEACAASAPFKEAFGAALLRAHAESADTVRKERDRFKAALIEILSGVYATGRHPRDIAKRVLDGAIPVELT